LCVEFFSSTKYQYTASLRFMHPQTPRTAVRSDELIRFSWFMHPRSHGRQRIWTSYLDLAGYFCLKDRRNAFKK